MSAPTAIERKHYAKLVGRQITGVGWEELEGWALPILLLDGEGRDPQPAHAVVLADPEGNGRGSSTTTYKLGCFGGESGRPFGAAAFLRDISRLQLNG